MKKTRKNLISRIRRSPWLKGLLAFAFFMVTGPSFAIVCSHQSNMSQADMLACMSLCNSAKADDHGQATISKVPCMKLTAADSQVAVMSEVRNQASMALVRAATVFENTTQFQSRTLLALADRGPPRVRISAGYPAVPTSHGPPQG